MSHGAKGKVSGAATMQTRKDLKDYVISAFWYAKKVKKVLKKQEISSLIARIKLYEAGKRKWTASADNDCPDTSMHMHVFWTDEDVLTNDAEDDAGWGFVRYHWRIRT